jgi:hypothetical protein
MIRCDNSNCPHCRLPFDWLMWAVLVAGCVLAWCLLATGCSAVFHAARDREASHELPCPPDPRWHECHERPGYCCPDGFSCSEDTFTPLAAHGMCQWEGGR